MQSNTISIQFEEYQVPEFRELRNTGGRWIYFGQDNYYPDYLLDLFRRSPKHSSIIRGKAGYVIGKGFKFKEQGVKKEDLLKSVNSAGESMLQVGKKMALDYELYEGFALSVTWNGAKKIGEINHIDFHKVRSNQDNTVLYVRELGWKNYYKQETAEFPAFDPGNPKGTQILYYKGYTPGLNTYTLPIYIGAINYIEADAFVSEHTLNNAKTGFTASKMINFMNGEPAEEEKKKIEKGIKDKYSGRKGSKIILTFNNDKDKAPTVLDLGASDLTKEDFQQVDNLIQQNIFSNHQVTSPMLFGIKSEGQLGGTTELRTAYEIFKNTYVDDRQDAIIEVWNTLNFYRDCPEVSIIQREPVGLDIWNNSKLFELLPKSFVYEKIGINPADYPELEEEQQKKEEDKKAAQQAKFSADEDAELISCFAEVGAPKDSFIVLKSKKVRFASDEDCVAYEHMAFADITTYEASILDLIKKDKRITPEVIADTLQLPLAYVERLLGELESKGVLKSKTEKVGDDKQIIREETKAAPEKKAITTEVYVKYSYEGPKDDRNRAFCAKLMELDRLYSRSEIEQISQRVGYSVWERRGGFYHNPDTDVTQPYCRHKWVQQIVIKKK